MAPGGPAAGQGSRGVRCRRLRRRGRCWRCCIGMRCGPWSAGRLPCWHCSRGRRQRHRGRRAAELHPCGWLPASRFSCRAAGLGCRRLHSILELPALTLAWRCSGAASGRQASGRARPAAHPCCRQLEAEFRGCACGAPACCCRCGCHCRWLLVLRHRLACRWLSCRFRCRRRTRQRRPELRWQWRRLCLAQHGRRLLRPLTCSWPSLVPAQRPLLLRPLLHHHCSRRLPRRQRRPRRLPRRRLCRILLAVTA